MENTKSKQCTTESLFTILKNCFWIAQPTLKYLYDVNCILVLLYIFTLINLQKYYIMTALTKQFIGKL